MLRTIARRISTRRYFGFNNHTSTQLATLFEKGKPLLEGSPKSNTVFILSRFSFLLQESILYPETHEDKKPLLVALQTKINEKLKFEADKVHTIGATVKVNLDDDAAADWLVELVRTWGYEVHPSTSKKGSLVILLGSTK